MSAPRPVKIAASLLAADFRALGHAVQEAEQAGVDWLHLDVMDGRFVPNLSFGPPVIGPLRELTSLPFDAHLMTEHPEELFPACVEAGINFVTVHVEACRHLQRTLSTLRELGLRAGVTLNPATPLASIEEVLPDVDLVLLMTVNPGFGGQKFIPATLAKAKQARAKLDAYEQQTGRRIRLEIDGGVNTANIAKIARAGVDAFVAGSAVYGAGKDSDPHRYDSIIGALRQQLREA